MPAGGVNSAAKLRVDHKRRKEFRQIWSPRLLTLMRKGHITFAANTEGGPLDRTASFPGNAHALGCRASGHEAWAENSDLFGGKYFSRKGAKTQPKAEKPDALPFAPLERESFHQVKASK